MSKKNQVRGRKSKAQSPRSFSNKSAKNQANNKQLPKEEETFKINGLAVIDQYCLNGTPLFAVAEVPNDEDGYDISPVAYVENDEWFVDLRTGVTVRNGRVQNIFEAKVTYEKGKFIFTSDKVVTEISKEQLITNFGKGCIC